MSPPNLHATALLVGGRGILIRGPSGSGKSSLALSLLRRGGNPGDPARLVADDQVAVEAEGGRVWLSPFAATAGLIEIRGVGILTVPHAARAPLDLVVDLGERAPLVRLPEPSFAVIASQPVVRILLPARDPAFGADVVLTVLEAEDGPLGRR
ncbi:HPr kinase/phosphorylase [Aureimonas pseudogalii]|uniref:HPr kinase/phosphorylase n=1 Tax=Aureimonas pseudogalii TaxID=1744844 RepID=A0A7W6H4Q7_9HYPH|nr:HPr kinase/phosphatase C-terminal domain-containing protein [Aureimonas pseudogalii]MBB3997759.1 HPr kinase/phosphorylase [Aureimonas pseudogalii]